MRQSGALHYFVDADSMNSFLSKEPTGRVDDPLAVLVRLFLCWAHLRLSSFVLDKLYDVRHLNANE
jgi:hypothetical protein